MASDSLRGHARAANLKPAEINTLLREMVSSRTDVRMSESAEADCEGLSLREMREFVLTLIQRKDDLEERLRRLRSDYEEQTLVNEGLAQRIR